jgi:hypothetical protein
MLISNKFKGNVSFPEIELIVPGIYSIEYYYHFNCNLTSCLNSEVSMTIYFDYENNSTSIKHDIKNAKKRDATWVKNALNITTTTKNNLKVLLL